MKKKNGPKFGPFFMGMWRWLSGLHHPLDQPVFKHKLMVKRGGYMQNHKPE
jgi:hypothetical protein